MNEEFGNEVIVGEQKSTIGGALIIGGLAFLAVGLGAVATKLFNDTKKLSKRLDSVEAHVDNVVEETSMNFAYYSNEVGQAAKLADEAIKAAKKAEAAATAAEKKVGEVQTAAKKKQSQPKNEEDKQ